MVSGHINGDNRFHYGLSMYNDDILIGLKLKVLFGKMHRKVCFS